MTDLERELAALKAREKRWRHAFAMLRQAVNRAEAHLHGMLTVHQVRDILEYGEGIGPGSRLIDETSPTEDH